MNLQIPVILVILGIPAFLGFLVILRMLWMAGKLARSHAQQRASRKLAGPVVPLLDEPMPCPTCERQEFVAISRGNFQDMPYIEHFVCHGCGTEFLGPNQEKMVEKRLEARRKLVEILTGKTKKPKR